jgi:hypothetical protein
MRPVDGDVAVTAADDAAAGYRPCDCSSRCGASCYQGDRRPGYEDPLAELHDPLLSLRAFLRASSQQGLWR